MFLNVEQLEKQLDKEDFQEIRSMAAFNSINKRAQLKREYDSWVNERQMQTTEENVDTSKALDASSVDTESSRTESKEQDTSSSSGNDAHNDGVDIRPIYDEEPMVKVQTTVEINVFAIEQQHTEQPEFNNEEEVDQNAEECHDTCPFPAILTDNEIPEHSYQSLESKIFVSKRLNSEPSLMPSARSQSTANGSKPKPRSNTQTSRNCPASKSNFVTTKTVPIAEHPRNSRNDSCVTKFLKEVNLRVKVPSNKTTKRNKPVAQISVTKKPKRQIPKDIGKIFKTVGLRWVPTGKIFASSTTKVDNKPLNGSNADITNQYECEQTLDVSAGTLYLTAVKMEILLEPTSNKLLVDSIRKIITICFTLTALSALRSFDNENEQAWNPEVNATELKVNDKLDSSFIANCLISGLDDDVVASF
nr:hypothetical protein [Tanacetum cinerariifolium]